MKNGRLYCGIISQYQLGLWLALADYICCLWLLYGFVLPLQVWADATDITLENLLLTEVISAERITQQISNAPSAVTVVTAQDIQDYGYRNLAQILDSMRGLFVYQQQGYTFLGGRGFSGSGSLSGRLMLLLDGYNIGENFFNRVLLGDDSLIDVNLIDRVEYIPGAGAIRYGNTAFLGSINIITKKGQQIAGSRVAMSLGSRNDNSQRFTYGQTLESGDDVLVSYSRLSGREYLLSGQMNPMVLSAQRSSEETDNQRLFTKWTHGALTLTLAHAKSETSILTSNASQNTLLLNDSTYLSLEHDDTFSDKLKSSSHFYYGQYLFNSSELSSLVPSRRSSFVSTSQTRWWGLDQEFAYHPSSQHQYLFGFSIRDDYQAHFAQNSSLALKAPKQTYSLYVHDSYQCLPHLNLNYGARYDASQQYQHLSPRIALLWNASPQDTLKLSFGRSFRNPNGFELVNRSNNLIVDPEKVDMNELVWDKNIDSRHRLVGSVYRYTINNVIQNQYESGISEHVVGQELEYEQSWGENSRLRTSVAHLRSVQDSRLSDNFQPHYLFKFNLSLPLRHTRLRTGLDGRCMSHYQENDQIYGGKCMTNITLTLPSVLPNTDARLSLNNLFNASSATSATSPVFDRSVWLFMDFHRP